MNRQKLNFGQKVALESLWFSARCFAVLPYWFKYYVVEELLFFVLYYCARYRRKVVDMNLRNSFPEKSDQERARIRRQFYYTLAEMFVNMVNLAHMTEAKRRRIFFVQDLENFRSQVAGRDWIAMTAHFGCWEYCSYWGMYEPTQMVVAVYHPLRSVVMEHLFQRLRSYENSTTVEMKECLRFYLRNRAEGVGGKNLVMGLIADQNPPRRPQSHWIPFLNQDTIFFDGGEMLALRCHVPVYFVKMERLQRGRYRMALELIYDGEEQVAPNEITERYARLLEAMIRECPELWVWSHRRWKHKRPNANS